MKRIIVAAAIAGALSACGTTTPAPTPTAKSKATPRPKPPMSASQLEIDMLANGELDSGRIIDVTCIKGEGVRTFKCRALVEDEFEQRYHESMTVTVDSDGMWVAE